MLLLHAAEPLYLAQVTPIAELAALIISQLQAVAVRHISVLTDPDFTKDPVAEAEQYFQAMEAKLAPKPSGYAKAAEKSFLVQGPQPQPAAQGTPAVAVTPQATGNYIRSELPSLAAEHY